MAQLQDETRVLGAAGPPKQKTGWTRSPQRVACDLNHTERVPRASEASFPWGADVEENNVKVSTSKTGAGFGVSAGVDIRASNLRSAPIEANFMYGKPSDDISGLGISAGLTFNFGRM